MGGMIIKEKIKDLIKEQFKYMECNMCANQYDEDYCYGCCGAKRCYWSPSDSILDSISEKILEMSLNKD